MRCLIKVMASTLTTSLVHHYQNFGSFANNPVDTNIKAAAMNNDGV
jgi:hypothetical protein